MPHDSTSLEPPKPYKSRSRRGALHAMPLPALWAGESKSTWQICAFEKFLQELSYDELADVLAQLGFVGVEATVRQKGHVLPERVEEDLPKLHSALKRRGVEITIMTTDVLNASDPLARRVLTVASELGVKSYRMGHYRYDKKRPILVQLANLKPVFKELAAFNHELQLTGLYQDHSGYEFIGATVWDLHHLIQDIPPTDLGAAFDIRHATVEAGLSWGILYRLMKPHIGGIYVKDFRWDDRSAVHAPLGSGIDPNFFEMLREDEFKGPISLHVEYLPKAGTKANIEALRRDLRLLRQWLNA